MSTPRLLQVVTMLWNSLHVPLRLVKALRSWVTGW